MSTSTDGPSPEGPVESAGHARLVIYVASVSGAGKTRRLLDDARRLHEAGRRVLVGWAEAKGRPDVQSAAVGLPRIPPRVAKVGNTTVEDFDYAAALRENPEIVILDELAHENLGDAVHAKRWQDALALRAAGIGVVGALDIEHVETVARAAAEVIGHPVFGVVPLSFLQAADEVIALDVSPEILRSRSCADIVDEQTLSKLRELLLHTVDSLTLPAVRARKRSSATAFVYPGTEPLPFLRRSAAIAHALDLAFEVAGAPGLDLKTLEQPALETGGEVLGRPMEPGTTVADALGSALVALPIGKMAARLANAPLASDLFIAGAGQTYLGENAAGSPYSGTAGDRMRVGYGHLTVYIAPAAGSGTTFAMLDRAHQLAGQGVDVVAAFVEAHGRPETAALLNGLESLPPKLVTTDNATIAELDRDALIARHPKVALIDELAHTNAPGSIAPKRYQDVLAAMRDGIDVITTLNVQQLEGLGDTVHRLTGLIAQETLPDGILALADEIVLIDITPDALHQRVREGKVYPPERADAALGSFLGRESLFALRELALREALRSRYRKRVSSPFERILVSVGTRPTDIAMIRRASRIAARLAIEFAVAHIAAPNERAARDLSEALRAEARKTNAEWIEAYAADVPGRLLEIARKRPETTIAVAGTHRKPHWPQPPSFARRLLDAGARELLVLTPPAPAKP